VLQVFKRNDDALFDLETKPVKPGAVAHREESHMDDKAVVDDEVVAEEDRYVDLETLKADVTDKFRGCFAFYLQRNMKVDLEEELDCLQDMAKIVQAEVVRIGLSSLDVIFLVAYDLLVLRGVDKHTAASIIARVSVRYHLL
jgi:hypothetical protein